MEYRSYPAHQRYASLNDLLKFTVHYLAQASNKEIDDIETNFLDLFSTPSMGNHQGVIHGLDRLSIAYTPEWGSVTLGRQAVTWGNGLLFNPMDIFSPFSPSAIDRDYKPGTDMVLFRTSPWDEGEIQLIYVPRRDLENGNPASDQSSWGGRLHLFGDTLETDLMAASHRRDTLVGAGITGYLGGTAWRMDGVYTWSGGKKDKNYLSLTANMDYSWIWFDKNLYGFMEGYWSGLGSRDYTRLYTDPDIRERSAAGDLYFMGRTYGAAHIQLELHPLLNIFATLILNLGDNSCLVQPRLVWTPRQNLELTLGANLYQGEDETEFGEKTIPGTGLTTAPGNNGYLWATFYF